MEFISKSEIETEKIAFNLAKDLKSGSVLALYGQLGSGKTVFARGLARGLGVREIITSPTFVLIKEYPIKKSHPFRPMAKPRSEIINHSTSARAMFETGKSQIGRKFQIDSSKIAKKAILKVVHVDCYRVRNGEDAETVGLNEYLNQTDSIIIIEWPEKIKSILPKRTVNIYLENLGLKTRKITFN